jgi:hypothetical protein
MNRHISIPILKQKSHAVARSEKRKYAVFYQFTLTSYPNWLQRCNIIRKPTVKQMISSQVPKTAFIDLKVEAPSNTSNKSFNQANQGSKSIHTLFLSTKPRPDCMTPPLYPIPCGYLPFFATRVHFKFVVAKTIQAMKPTSTNPKITKMGNSPLALAVCASEGGRAVTLATSNCPHIPRLPRHSQRTSPVLCASQ